MNDGRDIEVAPIASPAEFVPGAHEERSHFSTGHLRANLGSTSARGAAATLGGRVGRLAIQLIGLAALSRLLAPGDFGLVNMVAAMTGFLMLFGDMGLATAAVQRPEVTHLQMSSLFWLNAALGLGMTLLTAGLAPAVAWFYHDPRLRGVTVLIATGFFITGLGMQHQALLKRQMRFGALAVIDLIAGVLATVAAITAAWLHFGYWSLVLLQLTAAASVTVGCWICCGWRPGFVLWRPDVRSMVVFGGDLTAANFMSYIIRNLDNVLIGWRWGAESLGYYSRAYQLLLMPISQITGPVGSVVVPALSRLQNDEARYRSYYLKGLNLIAYLTMPLIFIMIIFSNEIVYLALGSNWGTAGRLFRILAVSALFQPILSSTSWLYVSLGQTRVLAWWTALNCPLMAAAFAIGLPWGAAGVAYGFTTVELLITFPGILLASRVTPIRMKDFGNAVRRPLAVGILLAALMLACRMLLAPVGAIRMLAISALAGALLVFLLGKVWTAVGEDWAGILAYVSTLRGSREAVRPA